MRSPGPPRGATAGPRRASLSRIIAERWSPASWAPPHPHRTDRCSRAPPRVPRAAAPAHRPRREGGEERGKNGTRPPPRAALRARRQSRDTCRARGAGRDSGRGPGAFPGMRVRGQGRAKGVTGGGGRLSPRALASAARGKAPY
ncbi:hypothetical protein NL676_023388 [Syzygium grande]|nr:hypothetical protein NL676_023388 [Syzygium grande]